MDNVEKLSWQQNAACLGLDTDMFFPEQRQPAPHAKAVCMSCPVRTDCLTYAVRNNIEYGIWGGTNETERRGLSGPRRGHAGHGTRACYCAGCRCDDCRRANAIYRRERHKARWTEPKPKHNLHGPGGRFVKRTPDDAA